MVGPSIETSVRAPGFAVAICVQCDVNGKHLSRRSPDNNVCLQPGYGEGS